MKKLFLILTLLVTAVSANAADLVKNARANDVATQYILKDNGDLFRVMKHTGRTCQVTNRVQDLKISQHPNDVAMVYYIKEGDLYYLTNAEQSYNCPKANKKLLLADIKRVDGNYRYGVVSSTKSDIVNVALNYQGDFKAWGDSKALYSKSGTSNYKMNTCFGQPGMAYSRTSVLLISRDGYVTRLEGKRDRGNDLTAETDHSRRYSNIDEFVRVKGMCRKAN